MESGIQLSSPPAMIRGVWLSLAGPHSVMHKYNDNNETSQCEEGLWWSFLLPSCSVWVYRSTQAYHTHSHITYGDYNKTGNGPGPRILLTAQVGRYSETGDWSVCRPTSQKDIDSLASHKYHV